MTATAVEILPATIPAPLARTDRPYWATTGPDGEGVYDGPVFRPAPGLNLNISWDTRNGVTAGVDASMYVQDRQPLLNARQFRAIEQAAGAIAAMLEQAETAVTR